jgi:hypothetical protein
MRTACVRMHMEGIDGMMQRRAVQPMLECMMVLKHWLLSRYAHVCACTWRASTA